MSYTMTNAFDLLTAKFRVILALHVCVFVIMITREIGMTVKRVAVNKTYE